jgi:hypothetical protein
MNSSIFTTFVKLFSRKDKIPLLTTPNLQGTWEVSYKVLRIERDENIPKSLTPDFFENKYEFNYADNSSDEDNSKKAKIIIKQDKNDKRFCIIYEPKLPGVLRPESGFKPAIIQYHGNHDDGLLWELNSPDYDDNGNTKTVFTSGPKNNNTPTSMTGIYLESGYSELGFIQTPTIGVLKYTKLSDSIILPSNINTRCMPYKVDLNTKYFSMKSDNFIKEKCSNNIKLPENFYYNRFVLDQTKLSNECLEQFSKENNGVKFQYATNFKGPIYNSEKTEIIGMVTAVNGYKLETGINKCLTQCRYRFYKEPIILDTPFRIEDYIERKPDHMEKYELSEKESMGFTEFKIYYHGKLGNNNFALGDLTISHDQIKTSDTYHFDDISVNGIQLNGQSNGSMNVNIITKKK